MTGAVLLGAALVHANSSQALAAMVCIERMPTPLVAELAHRKLRVGTQGTPTDTWCELPLSDADEHELRQLSVPAARVVRSTSRSLLEGDPE